MFFERCASTLKITHDGWQTVNDNPGFNVNSQGEEGHTATSLFRPFSWVHNSRLAHALEAFHYQLAQNGIGVKLQNDFDRTALIIAAEKGYLDMATEVERRILEHDAPKKPARETSATETSTPEPGSNTRSTQFLQLQRDHSRDMCLVIQGHLFSCEELNTGETCDDK